MKKAVAALILILFCASLAFADPCVRKARELCDLQNRIARRSFQKLPKGAWASYGSVRAVFLGQRVSPKSGKRLDVIEVSGDVTGQIWYRVVPRFFTFRGAKLRFLLLEPVEAYMKTGGTFLYMTTSMVRIFLKGTPWGAFLKKGVVLSPPGCRGFPVIKAVSQEVPGGKRVRAYVIHSERYGGTVVCSPEIPFGLVWLHSDKEHTGIRLVKYGWHGGRGVISSHALKDAMSISFSFHSEEKKSQGKKK